MTKQIKEIIHQKTVINQYKNRLSFFLIVIFPEIHASSLKTEKTKAYKTITNSPMLKKAILLSLDNDPSSNTNRIRLK